MATWPAILPAPHRTLVIEAGTNVKRRHVQSGRFEARRFGSGKPDKIKASFKLFSAAEIAAFEAFLYSSSNLGTNWFAASWLPMLGYVAHKARILGYPRRKVKLVEYSVYEVVLLVQQAEYCPDDTLWPVAGDGGEVAPTTLQHVVAMWRADSVANLTASMPWEAVDLELNPIPEITMSGGSSCGKGNNATAQPPFVRITYRRYRNSGHCRRFTSARVCFNPLVTALSSKTLHVMLRPSFSSEQERDGEVSATLGNPAGTLGVFVRPDGHLRLLVRGSYTGAIAIPNPRADKWVVASVVYDHGSGAVRGFVNGQEVYSDAGATLQSAFSSLYLGISKYGPNGGEAVGYVATVILQDEATSGSHTIFKEMVEDWWGISI